jgi:SNF2 family DNA or RNA helicase
MEDFVSVLVLATQDVSDDHPDSCIVGARVRMVRLGLGSKLNLSYGEMVCLFALAEWRLTSARSDVLLHELIRLGFDQRSVTSDIWARCLFLWDKVRSVEGEWKDRCDEIRSLLQPVLPIGLALMEHQLEAVRCIKEADWRYIVNDDMGLGKTIVALATMLLRGDAFPVVIACPLSMVSKWASEAKKWLGQKHSDLLIEKLTSSSDWKKLSEQMETRPCAIFIGSWQQMITHMERLRGLNPGTLIGDESHYIANWDSQRTKAFLRIRAGARSVIELTGTIMPNGRHREVYPQIKAVDPDAFSYLGDPGRDRHGRRRGDWKLFAREYCGPEVTHLGSRTVTKYDGRSSDLDFGKMLSRHSIRRTKSEVFGDGELPHKTRYVLPVPVTPRDLLRFAQMRDAIRARIQQKAHDLERELISKRVPEHLVQERVKRVLSSQVVSELTAMRVEVGRKKAKWCPVRLKELLDDGHRIVVFCWHDEVLDMLEESCRRKFGADRVLVGRSSFTSNRRTKLIERGQAGEGDLLLLTSAYKEGIDLVSYDWVTMVERWWRPGDEMQAEDRCHRIGQEREVGVEYLQIPGTCDDAMTQVQVWKEAGQQQAFGSAEIRAYEWVTGES